MHPLDIWRAAKLLADRHGSKASGEVTERALSLRQDGDEKGAAVWHRIHEAVVELQRTMREAGEAKH